MAPGVGANSTSPAARTGPKAPKTPRSARLPRRGAITGEGTGQGSPGPTTGTAAAPARTAIGRGTRTGAILMPHSFVLVGGLSR
ncbi:hypothetical protein [Streptomyces sp. LN704]|uniref:hypothetical protein n=1 Tax=unclassified Streptomyces TaxID=2593676 RepID=UPI003714D08E